MPRIRTLKPEHKQHRKIGPLSDREYRLWVGMVTEADDAGRVVADSEQLRALVFPYHPRVRGAQVEAALAALARVGLVRLYTVNGTRYADFPSWRDHQRVEHPAPSKLPPYQSFGESSGILMNPHEPSVKTPGGSEGIGREGKGEDRKGGEPEGNQPAAPAPPAASRDPAHTLLAWLNTKAGRSYRPVAQNLDLIRARLKDGIQPWQLRAIVSRKVREWNHEPKPGEKDMRRYLRPETLFGKTKCEQYVGELPAQREEP